MLVGGRELAGETANSLSAQFRNRSIGSLGELVASCACLVVISEHAKYRRDGQPCLGIVWLQGQCAPQNGKCLNEVVPALQDRGVQYQGFRGGGLGSGPPLQQGLRVSQEPQIARRASSLDIKLRQWKSYIDALASHLPSRHLGVPSPGWDTCQHGCVACRCVR